MSTYDSFESVKALKAHYDTTVKQKNLKDLLNDAERNAALTLQFGDVVLDASHVRIDADAISMLQKVAEETKVLEKIADISSGKRMNNTENRYVLHTALRKAEGEQLLVEGEKDVVADVHVVRQQIKAFTDKVRNGAIVGHTGKALKNIVAIGIGGSALGPEFVFEALKKDSACSAASQGRELKFLANVDPIDFFRATDGLDVEETLFVIVSKTFTTAETMLNARSCRNLILDHYKAKDGSDEDKNAILSKHLCAVSTNLKATAEFGIKDENVFGFWEWVGGRFSASSAVGLLPLSLYYSYDIMEEFLKGMNHIDNNFRDEKDVTKNIPLFLGLIGFYNAHITGNSARTILPYCQALHRFPAHIQQLDMESNGKTVTKEGVRYPEGVEAGPIIFGEPGTNGQHSFYQLLHQGRVIPAEFIGFTKSQTPINMEGEVVTNHNELMSNFFAQPDALALGKDIQTLKDQGVPEHLLNHKHFEGNRPSLSMLFLGSLNAFNCGQLLAIYEHRVVTEGFIYNCNSFDQWGVELGKALAKDTRQVFAAVHDKSKTIDNCIPEGKFNPATANLLKTYLQNM